MRWFTDEAYAADDTNWSELLAGYSAHLAEIAWRLPATVAAVAGDPRMDLHDSRFREVTVDRKPRARS